MKIWEVGAALRAAVHSVELQDGDGDGGQPLGGPGGVAQSVGVPPPLGSTGGKLTTPPTEEKETEQETKKGITTKIDWLNFSGPVGKLEEVRGLVARAFGEPTLVERGVHTYAQHHYWPVGALLAWTDGRPECFLSLNGDSVDALGSLDQQLLLLAVLHEWGFRTTRVDLAADDWERIIPLELVHAAADVGNFTPFRLTDDVRPKRIINGGMELTQDKRTFGRRGNDGSGVFVRVYDKLLESKGTIDCIRWENEYSGEKAHRVGADLAALVHAPEDAERYIGAKLGGEIDFRVRLNDAGDVETHVDRRERLGWWAAFVAKLGEARTVVKRDKSTLQQTARWVAKSVVGGLAKLAFACAQRKVDFSFALGRLVADRLSTLDPDTIDREEIRTLDLDEAFALDRAAPGWGRGAWSRPGVTARGGLDVLEVARAEASAGLGDLLDALFGPGPVAAVAR